MTHEAGEFGIRYYREVNFVVHHRADLDRVLKLFQLHVLLGLDSGQGNFYEPAVFFKLNLRLRGCRIIK
mgnify:CR=1 FL=1